MTPGRDRPLLMLVDDEVEPLEALQKELLVAFAGRDAEIRVWIPQPQDKTQDKYQEIVQARPDFVVTDEDLSVGGPAGLEGASVVSACKAEAIPVGNFTRQPDEELPEPRFYDFRFPDEAPAKARYIADFLFGTFDLGRMIRADPSLHNGEGPAAVLATLMGRPEMAPYFSLYASKDGASNVLPGRLARIYGKEEAKNLLAISLLSHMTYNAIMRYPGPIIDAVALCAYLAIGFQDYEGVKKFFEDSAYGGPFTSSGRHYWHPDVEKTLLTLSEEMDLPDDLSDDVFRRGVIARLIGREPARHACKRCGGVNGGYICPYTRVTVCTRRDCSAATSDFVPTGSLSLACGTRLSRRMGNVGGVVT